MERFFLFFQYTGGGRRRDRRLRNLLPLPYLLFVSSPHARQSSAIRFAGLALLVVPILLMATFRKSAFSISDLLYAGLLALHAGCALSFLVRGLSRGGLAVHRRSFFPVLYRAPEVLLTVSLVFLLFVYIYATNANMSYVQRFIATGGNLGLAPNSDQERLAAAVRFLPLLAADFSLFVFSRLFAGASPVPAAVKQFPVLAAVRPWALPLCMLSGVLYALCFPSFLSEDGFPALGYVCLIPLLVALQAEDAGWGVFLGTAFGLIQSMITNYWLGTFDLVSLQFQTGVSLVEYLPFMAITLPLARRAGKLSFLVFPAAWTLFDYLKSLGFLGYPWDMLGTSQYRAIPLIQISSITGVWGVTFLLTLFNAAAAEAIATLGAGKRPRTMPFAVVAATFCAALAWGAVRIAAVDSVLASAGTPVVRLALVQQNGDPRKDDYRRDFETLERLTDRSLSSTPDLVVWSETAFVANIRRWSAEDPAKEPLAALVRDFLAYQKSIGTWLLTGNDDYELVAGPQGEKRLDYNAAVLFSPDGRRVETYHKIHLVPFTEYFPYAKELPQVAALLKNFDVHLWEPGRRRVVFRTPSFSFSTPICFEDVFPSDVRAFVAAGADAIVNLSNDYWSLTHAEAMQHAVNGLFRAVENGKPLARAAASGLTCLVDPLGRITARAPLYEQALLTVDMKLPHLAPTPYALLGDWFPWVMAALLILTAGIAARRSRESR